MTAGDARAALELAKPELQQAVVNERTYWLAGAEPPQPGPAPEVFLLPGFDEYLLGYADRSAALDPAYATRVVPGNNGIFLPTLVIDGRVAGTWKRTRTRTHVAIQLSPFAPIADTALPAITAAAERYGRFLGLAATLEAMTG